MIPELFSVGKSLKAVYDFSQKASNFFLTKKIDAFNENPQSEKSKEFWAKLKDDHQEFEKIMELLIHHLISAESTVKAKYIRNLVDSYSEGKIDWLMFCRMNFILSQIYTFDLEKIVEFYYGSESKLEKNDEERFFTLGLVNHVRNRSNVVDLAMTKDLEVKYEKNDLGEIFVDCVLHDEKIKISQRHQKEVEKSFDCYNKVMKNLLHHK